MIKLTGENRVIGNILLSQYNPIDKTAHISLLIGERDYWGKGYGTEAVRQMTELAFTTTDARKLKAGMMEYNGASYWTFAKNGYQREGKLIKEQWFWPQKKFVNVELVGLLKDDWLKAREEHGK